VGKSTSQLNLYREPRYYAWIAFENGFYEITNKNNAAYGDDWSMKKYGNKRMVTSFLNSGNCGRKNRERPFSPGGFLNKKGVHPDNTLTANGVNPLKKYPWPVIRLAELYLGYAECCAEVGTTNDMSSAKIYLNKVRDRAGIPDVDTSWAKVGGIQTSKQLRDIVRQERQIELYLENQNFWDMRRWELADQYFGMKHSGMNIAAENIQEFSVETEIPFTRSFQEYHWLLPIPATDVNNNHNLIQNPGY
ncbi:MAG: RagB/SusD family nutrient uptake outer membrane protein, partial [Bacteroidales bacterium]